MQRLANGENPKHVIYNRNSFLVLAKCLENGKMTPLPKKEIKGLTRRKTKQLRIKFHCTCRMPCNNIEDDEIDRMLQNVAFK